MGTTCATNKCFDRSSYREQTHRSSRDKNLYIFIKQIGKGNVGKVWKVQHKTQNKFYAIKIMKKTDVVTKKLTQYIIKERKIMSQIQHPFIVNMNRSFQDKRHLYLTLDYMPNGDLRKLYRKHHLLNEQNIRFIVTCILIGLQYLHSKKIVHRDIKPQNIMIDNQGYFRIGDFGISIQQNASIKESGGTIGYISPQSYFKTHISPIGDYFSLGVMMYEMFVHERPAISRNKQKVDQMIKKKESIKVPENFKNSMSSECESFINKLLSINHNERLGMNGITQIWNHPWLFCYKDDIMQIKNKAKKQNFFPEKTIRNPQQGCEVYYKSNQEFDPHQNENQCENGFKNIALQKDPRFQSLFKGYEYFKK